MILPGVVNAGGPGHPGSGRGAAYKSFSSSYQAVERSCRKLGLRIGSMTAEDIRLSPRCKSWLALLPSRAKAQISPDRPLPSAEHVSADLREGQVSRNTYVSHSEKEMKGSVCS